MAGVRTAGVLLALVAGMAMATPPARVILDYSDSTHVLSVVARHSTFAPSIHHVALISVMVNDSTVARKRFSSQTNKEEQDAQFALPNVRPGDRLAVMAVCSLFGSRTETLVIP